MSEVLRYKAENHILASLPTADFQRLSLHLQPVELHLGQVLYEADELMQYAYFPSNSIISLVSEVSDGSMIEIGIAGYEGMVAVSSILGVDRSPYRCLVQVHGKAMRMRISN